MQLHILGFGIAKDIFEAHSISVSTSEIITTAELKQLLEEKYPALKDLASYMIAVNNNYATGEMTLSSMDEIAVIPPVSGG